MMINKHTGMSNPKLIKDEDRSPDGFSVCVIYPEIRVLFVCC